MTRDRASKPQSRSLPESRSAFINIPYDSQYEPLYLAFIAGLVGFGLLPRATLEIASSERRLDRILQLIRSCGYSFHDISRVQLERRRSATPRFNMPFELGIAVAYQKLVSSKHNWFVLDSRRYRPERSLSDLTGTDPLIHDGRPSGLFRELTNVLSKGATSPTVDDLQIIYRHLRRKSGQIRRSYGSLFKRRPFMDLILAAELSRRKKVIPRRPPAA